MPGIKTGDMGPKLGFTSKDNGWMTMNNVRIPKENLFQRFLTIDKDGTLEMVGDPRILFSTMLKTRFMILSSTRLILMVVLTIAIRYSVVRR